MELAGRIWARTSFLRLAAVFRLARYNDHAAARAMGLSIKASHDFRPVRSVFDELAARESRLEVVPVADPIALAELPAEQDLAAATQRRKVDEPLVRILHIDT